MGHPISSENGFISQKILLKSELYYTFHVAMFFVYSYLKYGVFITIGPTLYKFINYTVRAHDTKITLLTIFAGNRFS